MIEVCDLVKIYGKKQNTFTALDNVSFSVPTGASVAILGKSGSGKSTLMHVMSGLDRPTGGQIRIDGKDISKLRPKEMDSFRSNKMSFIFQSFFVQGNESCFDNVSLPLEIGRIKRKYRKPRVIDALKAVELGDKVKSRARDLSGGQKQRLAIARAIVNHPSILFADEPTGNLDSATGAVVERLLFNYHRKKNATLIIVTHDPELAEKCDMQVLIKDGAIVAVEQGRAKSAAAVRPARRV